MSKKKISILGSTGSIGVQTLDVVKQHPELFEVEALAAGTNVDLLLKQALEFRPKLLSIGNEQLADRLRRELPNDVQVVVGEAGLLAAAAHHDAEFVVSAMVGSVGLKPTLAAIEAGKTIGLANKETLVTAGHIVKEAVARRGVRLLPIDSEHSAIFQCLNGEQQQEVAKLILTASGGSFRDRSREQLHAVTIEDALKHPNWSMGAKITIDSATMANKGLEVIEAHWLFSVPYDHIEVLLHPESTVHSMVEFVDGSVVAQLGSPDMRVPIQYALTYPHRLHSSANRINLAKMGKLHFAEMDMNRFPMLRFAFEAGRAGGTAPTVLNAANEIAVARFLQGDIAFLEIDEIVDQVLHLHSIVQAPNIEQIIEADEWARNQAQIVNSRFN